LAVAAQPLIGVIEIIAAVGDSDHQFFKLDAYSVLLKPGQIITASLQEKIKEEDGCPLIAIGKSVITDQCFEKRRPFFSMLRK
jgi:hypothetical protein